ncbi:hypothetical protein B0T20DRAFT_337535, partial [Sordaria brevicollis]
MSKPGPSQAPHLKELDQQQDSQNPPDYPQIKETRLPPCPRCTYRAANVGKLLRTIFPEPDYLRAIEITAEMMCRVPKGKEKRGKQCICCRAYNRGVEFDFPPGKGFEETSVILWNSLFELAYRSKDNFPHGKNLASWNDAITAVENASRNFLVCWHEICRQHGKDLLHMTSQELISIGCTSVRTVPVVKRTVEEAQPTATPRNSKTEAIRNDIQFILEEVQEMRDDIDTIKGDISKTKEN